MIYDVNGNVITVEAELGSEIRDIPQNRGVYLGYKRAHQLADVKWNALSAVPNINAHTGVAAGQHTGIVYSSVKECDKYIGYNVSLLTFMTAVHNPYSLLYTEDVNANRSASGYGFTYHGTNCGAYFGAVCNTFALFAVGMPIDWNTAEWAYLNNTGVFEKPYDQSAYGFELMDLVWEPGHGNVIIDIYRDNRGVPVTIYWAEEINPFPVIHAYTLAQAQNRLAQNNGIIYRYKDIYKSLDYTPSPFIHVEGETTPAYQYNDDICTYAGDYAAFYEGEAVHINYAKGSYTSMQLYKGDTLIQTITLPSSYNATHSIDVSSYLTGYGKYKAQLTDGTNNSDYTYFEVIETDVSVTHDGFNLTVNFSSANGTPQYVQLTYRSGKSMGIYALSDEEIAAGTCTFNALDLANSQSYGNFGETVYVKVFFVGDYGIVRNDWLNSGLR